MSKKAEEDPYLKLLLRQTESEAVPTPPAPIDMKAPEQSKASVILNQRTRQRQMLMSAHPMRSSSFQTLQVMQTFGSTTADYFMNAT